MCSSCICYPPDTSEPNLEKVGLFDWASHLPNELSGGQKQRVAIARALASEPKLLLADEPTGALDSNTSAEIMAFLQKLNDEGKTILIVTHERDIANMCKRIVYLKDGIIMEDNFINQFGKIAKILPFLPLFKKGKTKFQPI